MDFWLTCDLEDCEARAVGIQRSSNKNYYLYCNTPGHPQAINKITRADGDGTSWAERFDDWRNTTYGVFSIIKKCAEEECDGDYAEAWQKCYTRFVWS